MAATSWLAKVGAFIGKVLGIVQKVEPTAAAVATALLPQFAPEIMIANDIFSKVVAEVIAVETSFAAAGKATGTGTQKLATVLGSIGPVLDTWVANNFPGAKPLSEVVKSGIVNSVVAMLNELAPPAGA